MLRFFLRSVYVLIVRISCLSIAFVVTFYMYSVICICHDPVCFGLIAD